MLSRNFFRLSTGYRFKSYQNIDERFIELSRRLENVDCRMRVIEGSVIEKSLQGAHNHDGIRRDMMHANIIQYLKDIPHIDRKKIIVDAIEIFGFNDQRE